MITGAEAHAAVTGAADSCSYVNNAGMCVGSTAANIIVVVAVVLSVGILVFQLLYRLRVWPASKLLARQERLAAEVAARYGTDGEPLEQISPPQYGPLRTWWTRVYQHYAGIE
jgi:hypothetical protein